ncbi:MAG: DUF456 family protein, partial [Pseudomonadales bacterium]
TTIGILGVLTALAWLIAFLAAALGARRLGASQRAFWGAAVGALGGMFFGASMRQFASLSVFVVVLLFLPKGIFRGRMS